MTAMSVVTTETPFYGIAHTVPITYMAMPSFSQLKQVFGKSRVSVIFDGRLFEHHFTCTHASLRSGDRDFIVMAQPTGRSSWTGDEIIKQARAIRDDHAPNGYRPAMAIEVYQYFKSERRRYQGIRSIARLVGLGSYATMDGGRYAAAIHTIGYRPSFEHRYFTEITAGDEHYLFVKI
ncbi:MAG: hypothetical protein U0487_00190 [Patescibacteria group bacterium]